jgi:hypothetical protein
MYICVCVYMQLTYNEEAMQTEGPIATGWPNLGHIYTG